MEEEEDKRREAAIESAAESLNSKLTPSSSSSVSQARLSKFQELHKRRLQIKEKTKTKINNNNKKSKGTSSGSGPPTRLQHKDSNAEVDIQCKTAISNSSTHQEDKDVAPNKPHKQLHWGLDTKERWERKSNM